MPTSPPAVYAGDNISSNFKITQPHEVVSVVTTADGRLEVIRRWPSHARNLMHPSSPKPDYVEKHIYAAVKGRIELVQAIKGEHKPAHTVKEKMIFPGDAP